MRSLSTLCVLETELRSLDLAANAYLAEPSHQPFLCFLNNAFTGQVRGCEQRFDDLPNVTQDS